MQSRKPVNPSDPDKKPVRHAPPGKGHGLLTAAHNAKGQEGAHDAEEPCEAEEDKDHGILTAAHNKEKDRP